MARSEILSVMRTFHRAMENCDVGALRQLVDPSYYLTHITGRRQSRDAWFHVMASKRYVYHSIKIKEDQVKFTEADDGTTAVAHGRGVFDATIEGMHAPWRLEFTMHFERQEHEGWIIKYADYTTW